MIKRRLHLIAILCLCAALHLGCVEWLVEIDRSLIETPSSDTSGDGQVPPPNDTESPVDDVAPLPDNDPSPDDELPPDDGTADAVAEAEEFLKAKSWTRIQSTSNGNIGFFEFFRSDLKLCSNRSFTYFQFLETTRGADFSREEFSGRGTWSIRLDEETEAVILVVNFTEVSEGEIGVSELRVTRNGADQTFMNGERVNVTVGEDDCE